MAEIIALSATDDSTRAFLAQGRLLETLASLLVSGTVANIHATFTSTALPPPPPPTVIPAILSSIGAIITGSNFRAQSFVLSPSIRQLFSNTAENGIAGPETGSSFPSGLLPQLHVPTYKSVSFNSGNSSAFPALASLQQARGHADHCAANRIGQALVADHNHANAVISWLIYLARSVQGSSRLHALRVLALVNSAIEADSSLALSLGNRSGEALQRAKERERQMAMLAVPLAVKLVQVASEDKSGDDSSTVAEEREERDVREQACDVLALLVQKSKELQAAAVDAGAVKSVCPVLKRSFDSITVAKGMWSAQSTPADSKPELPDTCRMGQRGLPPEVRHVLRCRETALEALAALAMKEDIHRKAIVEAGVVTCIIDSLRPLSTEFAAAVEMGMKKAPQQFKATDGNTTPVLLAACHAAKSLSRSVSLLRTSLIDAGITKPIFTLLTHLDPEVQIAATDVACNLLLEFSPMRDDLLAAGAIKTLTEHARQNEMGLRLASLWALKHLVLSASKDVKVNVLEELGTGWLVGAIQGSGEPSALEARDTGTNLAAGGVSISNASGMAGLSTPNAAGEQVDLLNPASAVSVSGSMGVDDEENGAEAEEEDDDEEDEDGEVMYDEAAGTHYQSSQLRSTLHPPLGSSSHPSGSSSTAGFDSRRYLSSVRELEQNPTLRAKRDDIAVQEQALDFVRNMLNGEDCAFILEHLLGAIGQDKVFTLLADKLAPITPTATSTTTPESNTDTNNKKAPIYNPTDLILSTVHVLTHIANSSPTHKQLLIAHPRLLSHWLPHFTHPDRRVRVICVWAVNSLTWVEDESDRQGAQQRARALREVGIEEVVRSLREDGDLDVRERVRTACRQLEAL